MAKWWLGVAAIGVGAVLYNLDAITGQWKFDRLCKDEGGPRFYAPVERDVGWEVEGQDVYDYRWPFVFDHVSFVRYQDKHGVRSDVRASERLLGAEPKYTFSPVDEGQPVRYTLRYSNRALLDDDRFFKAETQIIEKATGKVLASFTAFSYRWAKPERVILAAPTAVQCWVQQAQVNQFDRDIYTLGRKQ